MAPFTGLRVVEERIEGKKGRGLHLLRVPSSVLAPHFPCTPDSPR